jgi:hypothetical protein
VAVAVVAAVVARKAVKPLIVAAAEVAELVPTVAQEVLQVALRLLLVVPALVRQGGLGAQQVRLRVYQVRAQAPAVQVVAEVRRVQRVLVVVQLPLLPALRAVLLVTIL